MKKLSTNEPTCTNLNGQAHSLSSPKLCSRDNNLVDYSYIPENEICLTEHWPHSGEELPVISPGDDIEKSIHLNSDGSMTVEMKVRFKIKEEETINWSTTVSRSELSYYKTKLLSSTSHPDVQAVDGCDSSIKSKKNKCNPFEDPVCSRENKYESCEGHLPETQNIGMNVNSYRTYSTKKEKTPFFRPPTPGIRKLQQRQLSVKSHRRVSDGNIGENMSQIFCNKQTEHDKTQSLNDIATQSNQHIIATGNGPDCEYNKANIERIVMGCNNGKIVSATVKKESFEVSETTSMELLQRDMVGKTVVRKSDFTSERKDYVSFTGTAQRNRPLSAGKHIFQDDQFKFKEIKRSVSASVTFSEPSKLQKEESHGKQDVLDTKKKTATKILPCCESEEQVTIENPSVLSEKDMCISSDNHSTLSTEQKKKKKKKIIGEPVKLKPHHDSVKLLNERNMESEIGEFDDKTQVHLARDDCDKTISSPTTHGGEINSTNNNMVEVAFIPHVSTSPPQSEVSTVRKLKGNKQMAKVKPRWVKKVDEPAAVHSDNIQTGNIDRQVNTGYNLTPGKAEPEYKNGSILESGSGIYNNEQMQYPLTEHNPQQEGRLPKKSVKTTKKLHKPAKKQKSQKKKISSRNADNAGTHGSDSLNTGIVNDFQIPPNSLESYVQSWLKNIFPNTALPVIQLLPSTRLENNSAHFNISQDSQLGAEMRKVNDGEVYGNANNKVTESKEETNHLEAVPLEISAAQEPFSQQIRLLDEEALSILMEKSNYLTELYAQQSADFEQNVSCRGTEPEEIIKWMTNNPVVNICKQKPTTDVAVQVETEANTTNTLDIQTHVGKEDVFNQQLQYSSIQLPNVKSRYLEKSLSVPSNSFKATNSSSQLLLAWLLVLNLEQGMKHIQEDVSQSSYRGSIMFTLLQYLKKIAITERADDLKAAILNLQESALRHDVDMRNPTHVCEKHATEENSNIMNNNLRLDSPGNKVDTEEIGEVQNMEELCQKPDLSENNELNENVDDLEFFSTFSDNELSSEYTKNNLANEITEDLNHCSGSIIELYDTADNTSNCLNKTVQSHEEVSEPATMVGSKELPRDLSQKCSASPNSNVDFGNYHIAESSTMKKISKVKMMVQEMEQRKYSSQSSEHQKCLQSPISSDWSDYRQDSDESLVSDTLRASSEVMTESGEEQIQEKPHKAGFVKRAIERLYGKAESKIKPSISPTKIPPGKVLKKEPTPNEMNESMAGKQTHRCLEKENILRTLSSQNNRQKSGKQGSYTGCPKSKSLSDEFTENGNIANQQELSSNQGLEKNGQNKLDNEADSGVLIDKGRWLLKENHLVRRSPPEITGMYGHLDTTSADTFLDNTSDEVPYARSLCRINHKLPLADVSSSEIEDMAKPHQYGCHYFTMPHGSDSEPFSDATHLKSNIRPKTSGGLCRSKKHDTVSLESCTAPLQRSCEASGSLPSFTTVDFNFSDNKVHPLLQSKNEKPNADEPSNPSGTSRQQVREQDSLDKLHLVCGQHCPILTAIIKPVKEESRGFAYRRPSDIENLIFLPHQAKKEMNWLSINMGLTIDENNNMHVQNNYTTVVTKDSHDFDTNISLLFQNKKHFWKIKNRNRDEQYLFLKLKFINNNSNKLNCTSHTNNEFPQFMYVTKDENNNILY
ncbi:oxygen-regulated protein 1-like [Discoglossus pictus]